MRPILKTHFHRTGTVLLIWIMFSGCGLFTSMTSGGTAPANTESSGPDANHESVAVETGTPAPPAEPTKDGSSNEPRSLGIDDAYPLPFSGTKFINGSSLAAGPGKVWIGTLQGSIEEVDAQSGAFGRSLALFPGAGEDPFDIKPVLQLTFEGGYLWAAAHFTDVETYDNHPHLLAIDINKWAAARDWDQSLEAIEWVGENYEWIIDPALREDPENFCTSPGKIWMEGHVIDTRTFEVTPDAYNPGASFCAYNGKGWMWTTEWTGGEDGLYFVNADDLTEMPGQYRWPFLIHEQGSATAQGDSFLALAGERMWMGRSQYEPGSVGWLDAFPSDLDELMKLSGPPASVPLLESLGNVRLLYAGDYLWILYLGGGSGGWLYQLDPQTGKTLASLDLVGDEGRATGDFPMDIASAGDTLWVMTSQQLLRIKMP